MLEHHPPRREPRVLLLRVVRDQLVWTALDPWEPRGAGRLRSASGRGLRLAVTRIVLQVHPSALVAFGAWARHAVLLQMLRSVVVARGLPLVVPSPAEHHAIRAAALPVGELLVELPHLAPVRDEVLLHTAALAAAALSLLSLPPRHYVSGLAPPSAPAVGS